MLSLDPTYIIINLLLLFLFIRAGQYVANNGNYKFATAICTLAFTFVQGMRYMRGNDYIHYVSVFNERTESNQVLFTIINDILAALGINAYASFSVYALIFIVCLFWFFRNYKEYAAFLFPLSLIALIFFNEYMIRQALSFSFVFLFLDQLFSIKGRTNNTDIEDIIYDVPNTVNSSITIPEEEFEPQGEGENSILTHKKNLILCILFTVMATSIHTANIFPITLIFLFWLFAGSHTIPYYISIPLLLFSAFLFDKIVSLDSIMPYIMLLEGSNDKFDQYIDAYSSWFGEEALKDQYTRNEIILYLEIWGNAALFWLGDRISKKLLFKSDYSTLFNTYIIGTLFLFAFRNFELLNRMGFVLSLFWFFVLSIGLFHLHDIKLKIFEKAFLFGLVWWTYEYLKYLFMRTDHMTQFLWDIPQFI